MVAVTFATSWQLRFIPFPSGSSSAGSQTHHFSKESSLTPHISASWTTQTACQSLHKCQFCDVNPMGCTTHESWKLSSIRFFSNCPPIPRRTTSRSVPWSEAHAIFGRQWQEALCWQCMPGDSQSSLARSVIVSIPLWRWIGLGIFCVGRKSDCQRFGKYNEVDSLTPNATLETWLTSTLRCSSPQSLLN